MTAATRQEIIDIKANIDRLFDRTETQRNDIKANHDNTLERIADVADSVKELSNRRDTVHTLESIKKEIAQAQNTAGTAHKRIDFVDSESVKLADWTKKQQNDLGYIHDILKTQQRKIEAQSETISSLTKLVMSLETRLNSMVLETNH